MTDLNQLFHRTPLAGGAILALRRCWALQSLERSISTNLRDLKNAKKEWSQRLFNVPRAAGFRALAAAPSTVPDQNVVGVGIGEQIVDDKPTGAIALKFLVRFKYPVHELSRRVLLPKSVNGLLVDVEEVGFFRRFVTARPKETVQAATVMPDPKARSFGLRSPDARLDIATRIMR